VLGYNCDMRKFSLFFLVGLVVLALLSFSLFAQALPVNAQTPSQREQLLELLENGPSATSTESSTESAQATASAEISEKIQEKIEKDITTTTSKVKGVLAQFLEDNPAQPLSPINIVQYGIRSAVSAGMPANILVLLLLFPIVTTLIVFFRHVVGLEGFGVYTPAVLAVAFVSTGITTGLLLFAIVFIASWIGKLLVNKFRLQYLPRTSLLLWFVTVGMFGVLLLAPYIPWNNFTTLGSIGIFPLLVVILLSENFMAAQFTTNFLKAMQLTLETIGLALFSSLVMRSVDVQKFVILNPELVMLSTFVINLLIGKYTGLRFLEFFRFKAVIDAEE